MDEYRVHKWFLKTANSVITFLVVAALCLCGLYAGYCLWDNNRVFSSAENVQADMLKLKPSEDTPGGPSFDELRAVNPDVCAWITIDNTNIDYPVLHGATNLTYINTDVYGNFSLAGSIFLDSRNSGDFSDPYSLIYGHHMDKGQMFGDLDLFKSKSFFDANRTGTLLTPGKVYKLDIFACFIINAAEDKIFDPLYWNSDIKKIVDYAQSEAMFVRSDAVAQLRNTASPQVLALSTCSTEFSNARTILLASMTLKSTAE